jgi:hypothetical protein
MKNEDWLKIPGTPNVVHKGGSKVVVDEDKEPREQFVAMYRKNSRKGPLDGKQNFEVLSDAQICVSQYYRKNMLKFKKKFKWVFALLAYIGFSILYYLTLFPYLLSNMVSEETGWYKFAVLVVIIIILPGFIIWDNREELKNLWEGG